MKRQFRKLVVLLLALLCLLLASCKTKKTQTGEPPANNETQTHPQLETTLPEVSEPEEVPGMPWEESGAKQPEDYTWEEYEALSTEQRKAFQKYLGPAGFAAWLEKTQPSEDENPWDKPGAKQPKDYTWEEFEALTEAQQKAFMEHLGAKGLEEWLQKVQGKKEENPWDKPGAKQPKDYTWAEYQALTNAQKMAFMEHLGANGFQKWMEKFQGQKQEYPWDKPGAKHPQNYTWEEYEALTKAQQKAFREFLGTRGFEAWLERVLKETNPWEEAGAKQPMDYTWEEYAALTESQKQAFQEYLGARGFEDWMQNALQGEQKNPWEASGAKQPKDYTWEEFHALHDAQQAAFQEALGTDGFKAWIMRAVDVPWTKPGAKQPEEYTWKEYEDLTEPQQLAFRTHLGIDGFEEWRIKAQTPVEEIPWEKPGAKQPKDYTWEEFEALTIGQQMAFQKYLGEAGFEAWLNKVQGQTAANPWEEPGAKQPKDYTWEEFSALTAKQQMAFQKHLGEAGFEAWLNKVQNQTAKNPWDQPGAKQPKDYTWKEYETLSAEQQMAFQKHLGEKEFEAWLNKVQNQTAANPWDKPGAKQPKDYTMEEFEALTAEQQMAFQKHLGETEFEAWLNKAQSQTAKNPWDQPGAKQPQDYTMEEFEALSAAQQMAFQKYLGDAGFEAWLNKAQNQTTANPWDKPGAKQPKDYTWEEFEALSAAQQMAFQSYMGPEAFEAWMSQALGQI